MTQLEGELHLVTVVDQCLTGIALGSFYVSAGLRRIARSFLTIDQRMRCTLRMMHAALAPAGRASKRSECAATHWSNACPPGPVTQAHTCAARRA